MDRTYDEMSVIGMLIKYILATDDGYLSGLWGLESKRRDLSINNLHFQDSGVGSSSHKPKKKRVGSKWRHSCIGCTAKGTLKHETSNKVMAAKHQQAISISWCTMRFFLTCMGESYDIFVWGFLILSFVYQGYTHNLQLSAISLSRMALNPRA